MRPTYPLVEEALEEVVSGDYARRVPFVRMTRQDTAVTATTTDLHGPMEPFDLWASVRGAAA